MADRTNIKVFLVEDEFVIREGIRANIDWEGNHLDFCGEASDGELALPMIRERKPDIVITDIRMPFMDGLEMSSIIKKEFPWIRILLLTGYEEFEYARKGLEIGVAKYLTKPVSSEDLLREVKELASKIQAQREEQEVRQKYIREMEEQRRKDRRDFFRLLAAGNHNVSEMMEGAEKLGLRILASCYNMILLAVQPVRHSNEEFSESMIGLDEKINALENEDCIVFDRGLEGKALFLKAADEFEMNRLKTQLCEKLKELLDTYHNVSYFGGTGKTVHRLSEINICFAEAGRALSHRYFMEPNRILDSGELGGGRLYGRDSIGGDSTGSGVADSGYFDSDGTGSGSSVQGGGFGGPGGSVQGSSFVGQGSSVQGSGIGGPGGGVSDMNLRDPGIGTIDPTQYDREHISEFLHTGSEEEIDCFVSEFFRQMLGKSIESLLFRQYIAMDMHFLVTGFVQKIGLDRGQVKPLEEAAKAAADPESLITYSSELIREALRLRDQTAKNQYQEVVSEVIRYIENHYADEELSLNLLAAHVNFSPNHLSTIFSQETGQTFIKYLTDYRMKKAKALLRTSGKKSSEICFEVGYKDPHYFSYLFKKTQGMTPTEYRSGGSNI